MPTIFPGAAWVPIPGSDQRARRRKGRGVGLHVAVYIGPSIEKIDESTGNDSHLYVRRDGGIEQNVDLDLISYAMVDGNATLVTVETEGGADPATVETEPWTPEQCASIARICRWVHDTEGAPLQLMPDSRPESQGVGYHRQGVDPWRVAGGETWSTHYGKVCPGAAKIAQIPAIVAAASGGTPTPAPVEDDDMKVIESPKRGIALIGPRFFRQLDQESASAQVALYGPSKVGNDRQFDLWKAAALYGDGAPPQLDPAAIAAAVVAALPPGDGTPVDVEELAAKVVDDLVARLK